MFTPEIFFGIGALVILIALIWAINWNRTRNRANDAITEIATREQYQHPETYDERREELKKHLRPQ